MNIGKVIRALREQKGLTLEALAYDAGMSGSNISRIERGTIDPPMSSFFKLCMALDVVPSDVLQAAIEPAISTTLREEHQHYGHQREQLLLIFATLSPAQRKTALDILQAIQQQK